MSDKVTLKEKISYALVNLGNIPIQTILGSYLLIFYTNIVGLSPASCATLFLIARVLDGLNDPFVGFAIDHIPTTKHGHFRPTLVVGTILCSLNFLLLWFGPLMATSGKLAIAYVSYLLIGVLFPVMDISLNSMLPVMTTDMNERNTLSSLKGIVYMIGMFGLNTIAPIIIGNTTEVAGYIRLIVFVTIIVVVFSIVGAVGLKERVLAKKGEKKYGLKDLFKILIQRPVAITFLSSLVYMVGTFVMNTMLAYFFTYVIGNLSLISIVSIVQLIALIPASLLVGKLIQKFGKKKLYTFGLVIIALFPLLRLFDVTNIPILIIATMGSGFASGLCMPLTYGIQADNTDYINMKMNVHAEAAVAALSSFITKCGMGIGGAIPGYMLAAVGFNATAATQPEEVKTVIVIGAIVIPAVLSLIGAVIFAAGYPLTKEKLEAQVEAMKITRGRNE
ncbi:MFS transporter [Mediterraneibacter gnavus]|uniref:MFS transporter n=1 Tax=Mediterraneibacter gnavus TaxID=33038 RepID=UPI00232E231D|nr:glycoside-pentoside-hexuronide (GPH):cation symporter [Mediterraneibacter gnavus]MDB8711361.1 glycoside-pentoside-hexuronide (GPH):cation symporter [Mediterraneibacter gnavus]MDB8714472.1 glycoside-pentoside-hexuronide (GPH):cation symporter [Mediterraneibacter gnavus]